ncbi:MAG: hypothetical protein AAF571_04535 [Verrucomicrobiota bacterium]
MLRLFFLLLILSVTTLQAQNVLHLYGDVSPEGDVPSGDKKPFHQMRFSETIFTGLSEFKKALEAVGLTPTEVYDQDITLSAETLKDVDVLMLGSNQKTFTADEIAAVHAWVEEGGGLIAWSDSAFGGHYAEVGLDNTAGRDSDNLIMSHYGMYLLTDSGGGNFMIQDYTEDHFINASDKNGGIRFRGEGVSYIRTSPPARILAKAQVNGLGGHLRVNKVDQPFNPDTDAALSVAEIGKGRVVGLFDRNMLWNAGGGTRITHADNREFAQRMVLWAAGIEDESRIPSDKKPTKSERNLPPKLFVEHTISEDGTTLSATARYEDNDNDGIEPEIKWSTHKNSPKVIFENNNPNTLTPIMTLPEVGEYTILAKLHDGEFVIQKWIKVKRE